MLFVIIIVLVVNKFMNSYEHMTTTDEALQNIASLYNENNMKVGNFTSTQDASFNNLEATGISKFTNSTHTKSTIQDLTAPTFTSTTGKIDNLTAKSVNATNASVYENADVDGNLTVKGLIDANRRQVKVAYPVKWNWDDLSEMVAYVSKEKLFTKSMPDGTAIDILHVHPEGMDKSHSNRYFRLHTAVKWGNQFLLFDNFRVHGPIPDPKMNASSDLKWRGNILE